jgi:hypothetical protein
MAGYQPFYCFPPGHRSRVRRTNREAECASRLHVAYRCERRDMAAAAEDVET